MHQGQYRKSLILLKHGVFAPLTNKAKPYKTLCIPAQSDAASHSTNCPSRSSPIKSVRSRNYTALGSWLPHLVPRCRLYPYTDVPSRIRLHQGQIFASGQHPAKAPGSNLSLLRYLSGATAGQQRAKSRDLPTNMGLKNPSNGAGVTWGSVRIGLKSGWKGWSRLAVVE